MELLFPLLIVFMIGMLFVSSRQRKKQAQQTEALQNSVVVGDVVVMTSGISGTVVDTSDEKTIDLEIAPDVITTWLRAAVREKLSPEAEYNPHPERISEEEAAATPDPASLSRNGSSDTAVTSSTSTPSPADTTGTATPAAPSTSTSFPSTSFPSTSSPSGGASSSNGSEPSDEVSSPRTS